jgi:cytochrome P450
MLFRPERWLEAEGTPKLEEMERSVGLVWGYGKYSCLGKGISWLEMNKVFFEVSFSSCQLVGTDRSFAPLWDRANIWR